jgi:hypothetical protein
VSSRNRFTEKGISLKQIPELIITAIMDPLCGKSKPEIRKLSDGTFRRLNINIITMAESL